MRNPAVLVLASSGEFGPSAYLAAERYQAHGSIADKRVEAALALVRGMWAPLERGDMS